MVTIQMNGEVIPSDYADVYDYLGYESINPKTVKQALNDADGSDVTLEINSPGGYVDAGSEIYTALKEYQGILQLRLLVKLVLLLHGLPLQQIRLKCRQLLK